MLGDDGAEYVRFSVAARRQILDPRSYIDIQLQSAEISPFVLNREFRKDFFKIAERFSFDSSAILPNLHRLTFIPKMD